jgi:hypothetical protein
MNSSLTKLFRSQKSSNVHFGQVDVLAPPTRKKLVDSRIMFEQAVQAHKLPDTPTSFKDYSISYVFAIESILKQFSSIQRRISAHGVNEEYIQQFGQVAQNTKSENFIKNLFEQFCDVSTDQWEAFFHGYRDAEQEVMNICNYIYQERFARNLSQATIYTSFWDITSRELIEFPTDFV